MATTVPFWEKPGCISNTRQKTLSQDAGHMIEARIRRQGRSYRRHEMSYALLHEAIRTRPHAIDAFVDLLEEADALLGQALGEKPMGRCKTRVIDRADMTTSPT